MRPLNLNEPDLGAVLQNPGYFPERPQIEVDDFDRAREGVDHGPPAQVALDLLAGQVNRGGGGFQRGQPPGLSGCGRASWAPMMPACRCWRKTLSSL